MHSVIAHGFQMAGISFNESGTHAEFGDKRIARDEADVRKLIQQIHIFNPFGRTCEELICFSTNDVASNEIENDILSVTMRGSELLTTLVKQRLPRDSTGYFHDPIPQNNGNIFLEKTPIGHLHFSSKIICLSWILIIVLIF